MHALNTWILCSRVAAARGVEAKVACSCASANVLMHNLNTGRAARSALALKGIAYEYVSVPLADVMADDAHAARNPHREIPVLEYDGHLLTQSMAICEFLDEALPKDTYPLVPRDDPYKAAQVRSLAQAVACGIQPLQNGGRTLSHVGLLAASQSAEKATNEWGAHFINMGFRGIERALQTTAGKFCVGDDVTLADLFLTPQVFNATAKKRFNVDMTPYPTITRVTEALADVDVLKQAHPYAQPDTPETLRSRAPQ